MRVFSVMGIACLTFLFAALNGSDVRAGKSVIAFGVKSNVFVFRGGARARHRGPIKFRHRRKSAPGFAARNQSFQGRFKTRRPISSLRFSEPRWSAQRSRVRMRFGQRTNLWKSRIRSKSNGRQRWRSKIRAGGAARGSKWSRQAFF